MSKVENGLDLREEAFADRQREARLAAKDWLSKLDSIWEDEKQAARRSQVIANQTEELLIKLSGMSVDNIAKAIQLAERRYDGSPKSIQYVLTEEGKQK